MTAPLSITIDLTALYARIDLMELTLMTELANLQAAVTDLVTAEQVLATEQAKFLADIKAQVAALTTAAGVDPALLTPITASIEAQVANLNTLAAGQVAADPTTPPPAPAPAPAV